MGLNINMHVNTHNISLAKWEKTYEESLLLLQKFPAPLMRLTQEQIYGQKRYVYTANIINGRNTKNEHWEICGDLLSYKHAESFQLYRHLKQRPFGSNDDYKKNILWAEGEELAYRAGNGRDMFGNKTQGYPYHLALLAVTILFENRFPNEVHSTGDIDQTQVEQIVIWMNTILTTPVIKPICMDGERLYKQLKEVYTDRELVIRRFRGISQNSDEEQLEMLLSFDNNCNVLSQIFIDDLQEYSSLSLLGSVKCISLFLEATQDIRQLIKMVMEIGKNKSEFNLEELLRVLGKKFITISRDELKPLSIFTRPSDSMMNIDDLMIQTFLTMSGMPLSINFHFP